MSPLLNFVSTCIPFTETEEGEEVTVLKKSTYFLHDIYNWNGSSNGSSNNIPPSNQNSDENEHGETVEEEITYVKKILRDIVEVFVWTRKSVSRILSRSTRVALTAPKTLVLLLVPSILSHHNINAETINGVTPFPHGKSIFLSK